MLLGIFHGQGLAGAELAVDLEQRLLGVLGDILFNGGAVSYTHLDVYKRQVEDHPLGAVAGQAEGFHDLEPFEQAGPLLSLIHIWPRSGWSFHGRRGRWCRCSHGAYFFRILPLP